MEELTAPQIIVFVGYMITFAKDWLIGKIYIF